MPAAENGEKLLEMELLAAIGNIDHFVGTPGFEPVLQGGEVGGGVIEGTVAFSDEGGILFELRNIIEKDSQRAFTFPGDAFRLEFLHQRFKPRIIKTFAQRVVESFYNPRLEP